MVRGEHLTSPTVAVVNRLSTTDTLQIVCKFMLGQSINDHQCDKCGTFQWTHHQTNADGSHSHMCPKCGNVWWHGGPLGYPVRNLNK